MSSKTLYTVVIGSLTIVLFGHKPVQGRASFPSSKKVQTIARWVDALPIPPRIQVKPDTEGDLTITLNSLTAHLHRDLPPTPSWGYNGSSPGPTIEVESGHELRVHWKSALPETHLLTAPAGMDMGAGGTPPPDVRNVTHLHGMAAIEPSITDKNQDNDGWPDNWKVPGESQLSVYPNQQSARTLWYHDHAMGETGRNVAAGLIGMYEIHDDYERSLNLPSGDYDIPLILQTRGVSDDGSLYYTNNINSEFYGNAVAINGKIWPYLNVEPRKYRFRVLNASNARGYGLKLVDLTDPDNGAGPAFYQIGSDAGFLQDTAVLNDPADPNSPRLLLYPGERADVVIDFSKYASRQLLLSNVAPTDADDAEIPLPQLMVFNVAAKVAAPDTSQLPLHMQPIVRLDPAKADNTRQIVIDMMTMPSGETMLQLNGKSWRDPIDDQPKLGTTEVWNIVNTQPDRHPFHIHGVQFQVVDRTPIDVDQFRKTGKIVPTGPAAPPAPNEMGWKDVVRVEGTSLVRIIMKMGPNPGFYVYHCHILEHEDMDMMRPFEIVQ